jgi:hypothetical protein
LIFINKRWSIACTNPAHCINQLGVRQLWG